MNKEYFYYLTYLYNKTHFMINTFNLREIISRIQFSFFYVLRDRAEKIFYFFLNVKSFKYYSKGDYNSVVSDIRIDQLNYMPMSYNRLFILRNSYYRLGDSSREKSVSKVMVKLIFDEDFLTKISSILYERLGIHEVRLVSPNGTTNIGALECYVNQEIRYFVKIRKPKDVNEINFYEQIYYSLDNLKQSIPALVDLFSFKKYNFLVLEYKLFSMVDPSINEILEFQQGIMRFKYSAIKVTPALYMDSRNGIPNFLTYTSYKLLLLNDVMNIKSISQLIKQSSKLAKTRVMVLQHMDFSISNVLLDRDGLCVVDWESSCLAIPGYDLITWCTDLKFEISKTLEYIDELITDYDTGARLFIRFISLINLVNRIDETTLKYNHISISNTLIKILEELESYEQQN